MNKITTIVFDADDTLWINEPYFREAEDKFCALLEDYLPIHSVQKELFKKEMNNLPWYGYGIKAFMLSMVETILEITNNRCDPIIIQKALALGREMLDKPVILLDGVESVLKNLQNDYRLVVATKGDLLDQERKLNKSGLAHYFHHIEIMSNKAVSDYQKICNHLDCRPSAMVMIGNSIKSDILPVLELGGSAIHVPFHITWEHEHVDVDIEHPCFKKAGNISNVISLIHELDKHI